MGRAFDYTLYMAKTIVKPRGRGRTISSSKVDKIAIKTKKKLDARLFDKIKITDSQKELFLESFMNTGLVSKALEISGISRMMFNRVLKLDLEFRLLYEDAQQYVGDVIEEIAIERVTNGIPQDVYHKGEVVGQKYEFSDFLIAMLLKGYKPEKYKDRAPTVNNTIVSEINRSNIATVSVDSMRKLTDEELRSLIQGQADINIDGDE